MSVTPLPYRQIRPNPSADPGFRLDPNGRAVFLVDGHQVDVLVRYTTEEDKGLPYSAEAEGDEVLVSASVDVAGETVGRGWMLSEWHSPYRLREALDYAVRQAVEGAERQVDEMTAELAQLRAKRTQEASE